MRITRPVRRGHLISPNGVGALIDFPHDESLITAGLDEWPFAKQRCPPESNWEVREERLEAKLKVSHFRLPPEFREPSRGQHNQIARQTIPFFRFPLWHYCPRQGVMRKMSYFNTWQKCPCRPDLDCQRKRPRLIPSRFISVCPKGHIEDFPFMEWVHGGEEWDSENHVLRLKPGRNSAGLAGISIECSCGKEANMGTVFNYDVESGGSLHKIGIDCSGSKPWLGLEGRKGECGEYLRVLQRGASNVYFPSTVSSIYLPLWGEENSKLLNELLEEAEIWKILTSGLEDGKYIELLRCQIVLDARKISNINPEELKKAAQKKLDSGSVQTITDTGYPEDDFLRQEYDALRSGRGGSNTDLMVEKRKSSEFGFELESLLQSICLVKKLRETRVFVGFSRLLPTEDHKNQPPISKSTKLDWLPATIVYGEGIFFEFKNQLIQDWTKRKSVEKRIAKLSDSYNLRRCELGLDEVPISAKYVLLHTLAHALINQLSLDCGYGSAALRERIYCETEDVNNPMQGILIYTASGDSEGTLGGLVQQGEPNLLTPLFKRAIQQTQWCSSDPVCIESVGQGGYSANLAACHGCVLLPETSCEKGNRLLDRGLVVGTMEDTEIGFLANFLNDSQS